MQNSGTVIHDEGHAFFVSAFILRLSLGYKSTIGFFFFLISNYLKEVYIFKCATDVLWVYVEITTSVTCAGPENKSFVITH